jgi:hypothetical protein
MSMIWDSGAIRLITPWHVPTKSSWRPKSVRKVMNTGAAESRGSGDLGEAGDGRGEALARMW